MKREEMSILVKLQSMLGDLVAAHNRHKSEVAMKVSDFCVKSIAKCTTDEVDEILTSCIDLDHFGDTSLPPGLSVYEIRMKLIPRIARLIRDAAKE